MTTYTSLHNHSDLSPDGAGTIQSLVQSASKLGMTHLALTDHGSLGNAISFGSACQEKGITPIYGMEAYLLYNGKRHHLTLLSLNRTGFNNLIALDTWSHTHNYQSGYPLLTLDKISENREGLFALSGCISSALYVEDKLSAYRYIGDLKNAMGKDNLALEMMFIGTHDTWSRPYEASLKSGIPYVITNDTHYPCRSQYPAHQVITSARRGFTYNSEHLWLKSAEEIVEEGRKHMSTKGIVTGLEMTNLIASLVEPFELWDAPSLPKLPFATADLVSLIREALKVDIEMKGGKRERLDRVRMELKALYGKGFLDYIYILNDIVQWAKSNDIRVGPGRGSGGGSYVLYLLGITGIDPIEHNLLFERFLNPERTDYPDVDVDFESDRRQEVINYAREKWGAIPIATYSRYSHKSAVHDIARVLKIPKKLELAAAEKEMDTEEFDEFINYNPSAIESYRTMIGQIRHRGKHAAGIIIPNQPVPIERAGDELVAAWAEGTTTKELSKIGIVKYDLLGLSALSQLRRMEEITGVAPDRDLDCSDVYNLFCSGDTNGIFQWSGSEGIRELTKRIAPRNFHDLVTCNALYRPGALGAGTAENYPEFMKNPRKLHPRIDPLLEKTYGVLVYQEQVMSVVAEVMGGDLAQADIVRRLISKANVGDIKWEAEVAGIYTSFVLKGEDQGFPSPLLGQLWQEIYTHTGYSYNLSHATAYTFISYQMAWYKTYHRAAFTVAVLQYDKPGAQGYILDAVESGLDMATPHINTSNLDYTLLGNVIHLPLSDVAYLGEKGATFLIQERERGGVFHTYEEFDKRVPKRTVNNRARIMLERIGAFSGLGGDPSSAIKDYESIPLESKYQNQLEILGYVIPSPSLIKKMNSLRNQPCRKDTYRFAGFVQKVTKKTSVHGGYSVYDLSPEGSFWMRGGESKLKIGDFVSGTKSRFGQSSDVRLYKLSSI